MQDNNAATRRNIGPKTRRVLMRLAASVTVMAGLGAAARQEPPSAPLPDAVVERPAEPAPRVAETPVAVPIVRPAAPAPAPAVQLAALTAPGKTARLRPAAAPAPKQPAADVPYFDECEPACESHDPLLVGASLPEAEAQDAVFDASADDALEIVPVERVAQVEPDERPGLLRSVTRDVASLAGAGTRSVVSGLGHLSPW